MNVVNALFEPNTLTTIHAYEQYLHPCDDCKVCRKHLRCKYTDAMQPVFKALKETNTLIIASPIYFGALTDQLMRIINRFQSLFEAKFTHEKTFTTIDNLILISTCASTDKTMFQGATLTLDILKKLFNSKNTLSLTLTNTESIKDITTTYKEAINTFKQTLKKELI